LCLIVASPGDRLRDNSATLFVNDGNADQIIASASNSRLQRQFSRNSVRSGREEYVSNEFDGLTVKYRASRCCIGGLRYCF